MIASCLRGILRPCGSRKRLKKEEDAKEGGGEKKGGCSPPKNL